MKVIYLINILTIILFSLYIYLVSANTVVLQDKNNLTYIINMQDKSIVYNRDLVISNKSNDIFVINSNSYSGRFSDLRSIFSVIEKGSGIEEWFNTKKLCNYLKITFVSKDKINEINCLESYENVN